MKVSNKSSVITGVVLLLLAALFSISLILLPLNFGAANSVPNSSLQNNFFYLMGDMLYTVYGFSSILIPAFLLFSGLSCFAAKWTARKTMRLLTAIVPFFTSVLTENICRSILALENSSFVPMKVTVSLITGLMLIVIEYLGVGIIADKINSKSHAKIRHNYDSSDDEFDLSLNRINVPPILQNKSQNINQEISQEGNQEGSQEPEKTISFTSDSEVSEKEPELASLDDEPEVDENNNGISEEEYEEKISVTEQQPTEVVDLLNEINEYSFDEQKIVIDNGQNKKSDSENENSEETKSEEKIDEEKESENTNPASMITQEEFDLLTNPEVEESTADELEWPDLPPVPEKLPPEYDSDAELEEKIDENDPALKFPPDEDSVVEEKSPEFNLESSENVEEENAVDNAEEEQADALTYDSGDDVTDISSEVESDVLEEESEIGSEKESEQEPEPVISVNFKKSEFPSSITIHEENEVQEKKIIQTKTSDYPSEIKLGDGDDSDDIEIPKPVYKEPVVQHHTEPEVPEDEEADFKAEESKPVIPAEKKTEFPSKVINIRDTLALHGNNTPGVMASPLPSSVAAAKMPQNRTISDVFDEMEEDIRKNLEENAIELNSQKESIPEVSEVTEENPVEEIVGEYSDDTVYEGNAFDVDFGDESDDSVEVEEESEDFINDDVEIFDEADEVISEETENVELDEVNDSFFADIENSMEDSESDDDFVINDDEVVEENEQEIEETAVSDDDFDEDFIEEPVAPPAPKRAAKKGPYEIPTDLLIAYKDDQYWIIDDATKQASLNLKQTLSEFGIEAEIIGIKKGPVVTMFEILPAPGVRLQKIVALQDNIALSLAAQSVRIVAPIPGKQAVGIEIPNKHRSIVGFREMIEMDLPEWQKMAVPVILGKDILGKAQVVDLVKTPHMLIAGATGSGKSVCVNSLILSILYKRSFHDVKLILVDPKVVELKLYNNIPHLLTPVITEPKKALKALQYCLCEMERRYALLDGMGVRDISNYNQKIKEQKICTEKLPYIVVIIDEFADLMATSGRELESIVARLTAMSRAVGIHLVLATQRPSVNVITGLIKANIPTRIAFMVASRTDSNIIIDSVGAEKLLGRGDMLYASAVDPAPVRIQGTFISDQEVEDVVKTVKEYGEPDYLDEDIFADDEEEEGARDLFGEPMDDDDPLYDQALEIVVQAGKASASYIQRRLKIGYNRAARLVEEMEERGIVGPANGSKPREVIHMP